MNKSLQRSITSLAVSGLLLFTTAPIHAESEPGDDTPGGASTLMIDSADATGSIGQANDYDHYRITNSGNHPFIDLVFTYSGSGTDSTNMVVFGPNSESTQLSSTNASANSFSASYTIASPPSGAFYIIRVGRGTLDGTKSYTLSAKSRSATISPTSHNSPNTGDSYMINVTSSTSWMVSGLPAWATASPASGSGSGTVTVTVLSNSTALARTATLNIGGAAHMLSQAGATPATDNDPTDDTTGGATTLNVNQSATGDIANSDIDYYRITNTGGFPAIVINFSFDGTSPDSTRMRVLASDGTTELSNQLTDSNSFSASYTIASPPSGASYFICVGGPSLNGNKNYTLVVTADSTMLGTASHNSPSGGESYTVNVMSTTSWMVSGVPAWATASPTSGTGDGLVTVTTMSNPGALTRSATLSVGGQNHMLMQAALWADTQDLGGGTRQSPWFGIFNVATALPWFYHVEHGWIVAIGDSQASIWFYAPGLDWIWIGNTTYPFIYRNSSNSWLYYGGVLGDGMRWFLDLSTNVWEPFPAG